MSAADEDRRRRWWRWCDVVDSVRRTAVPPLSGRRTARMRPLCLPHTAPQPAYDVHSR